MNGELPSQGGGDELSQRPPFVSGGLLVLSDVRARDGAEPARARLLALGFTAQDGSTDTTVEAAVDEVLVQGTWVECQDFTPPVQLAPNPVGDTLAIDPDAAGHAVLDWQSPPVDTGHDPATLYRIERATSPEGPWGEVGSATSTDWMDIDALSEGESFYYRVRAENSGGTE